MVILAPNADALPPYARLAVDQVIPIEAVSATTLRGLSFQLFQSAPPVIDDIPGPIEATYGGETDPDCRITASRRPVGSRGQSRGTTPHLPAKARWCGDVRVAKMTMSRTTALDCLVLTV